MNCKRAWILAAVLVASRAGVAMAAYGDAESYVPRVEMPDKVYETLSAAIASYTNEKLTPRDLETIKKLNASALAKMRRLPWPDLKKLKLMRLADSEKADVSVTAWCVPGYWSGQLALTSEFDARLVSEDEIAKAIPRSYDDALAELLKSLGKLPLTGRSRLLDDGLDICNPSPETLLNRAYEAAWFGKNEAARKLVRAALRAEGLSEDRANVAWLYREWASHSYDYGFTMLEEGNLREEVLVHWKETLRLYPESIYVDSLCEMTGELEKQVISDRRLAATEIGAPERLPVEKRTAYYLARLGDIDKSLRDLDANPGTWAQVEALGGLINIGRSAVPGLMAHLADRGLTRITEFASKDGFRYCALRVQDVSLYAIEQIVETQFYDPSEGCRCFSDESESKRAKVIAEIKKWWEQHGDKPPATALPAHTVGRHE